MKRSCFIHLRLAALLCGIGLTLGGCLIKPHKAPVRYFILAPISAVERTPSNALPVSIEANVKMPSYLLRDSVIVRKSNTEFAYLDQALWAQRLDECFRQVLVENLSSLLASNQSQISPSQHGRLKLRVSVNLEQFDVNTQGRGSLVAEWRVSDSGSDKLLKSGRAHLTQDGPAPRGNPQAIADTLSALLAVFSRDVARELVTSVETGQ